jgi:hypothetical protein
MILARKKHRATYLDFTVFQFFTTKIVSYPTDRSSEVPEQHCVSIFPFIGVRKSAMIV